MLLRKKPTFVLRIGLVCFILSNVVGFFLPRTHLLAENRVDGARGFLLGVSIGLLLLSLAMRRRGGGGSPA